MANLDEQIKKMYDPELFHQYGDNPAYRRYVEIMQENAQEGKMIDPRTYVVQKLQRINMARNIEDFINRDLKAFNFVRAVPVWLCATGYFGMALYHRRFFFPIGQRGITSYKQTSFYQNFGAVGAVGFAAYLGSAAYLWWHVTKYTAEKFYKHVLLGERQWLYERERQNNSYGLYYFKDSPLSCEENFPDLARTSANMELKTQYMRIFKQAFDALNGKPEEVEDSRPKSSSISFKIDEQFMKPDFLYNSEQQKRRNSAKSLTKNFYLTLSTLETKFSESNVKHMSMVDQLVGMYQECVQAYDGLQDPIKYYFLEKIKTVLTLADVSTARENKSGGRKNQQVNPDISYFKEFEDFTERIDKPTEYSTPRADNVPDIEFKRTIVDPSIQKLKACIEDVQFEQKKIEIHKESQVVQNHKQHIEQITNSQHNQQAQLQQAQLQQAQQQQLPPQVEKVVPAVNNDIQNQQSAFQARLAQRQLLRSQQKPK